MAFKLDCKNIFLFFLPRNLKSGMSRVRWKQGTQKEKNMIKQNQIVKKSSNVDYLTEWGSSIIIQLIVDELDAARHQSGTTYTMICEKAVVDPGSVIDFFESGDNNGLSYLEFLDICDILDVDLGSLLPQINGIDQEDHFFEVEKTLKVLFQEK